MFLFVWANSWMHVFELVISTMCVCWHQEVDKEFVVDENLFLTEKWANKMCQKVKIVLFTRPQVHKRGDSYVYDGIKICQPFNIWRPKMQHLFVFSWIQVQLFWIIWNQV